MDLSIYKTLIDFEEYYLDEWEKSTELSRLEFLRKYQIEYKKEFGENLKKLTEYSSKIFYLANNYNFMISKIGLTNQMSPLMINHYGIIINQIVNELRAKKNIPKDLKDVISKDIKDYFNYCKELESYQKNNSNDESILNLIAVKIDNEKQNFLISGDVLFRQSIGRTDLPGGDFDTLINSIKTQLLVLPNETMVYSGHGQATTIGEEKRTNPYLV